MLSVQNIDLSFFTNLVVPVDVKQPVDLLVTKVLSNIKNKNKRPIIHLVGVVKDVNDYDLNRLLLQLETHKKKFIESEFIVTAEFIKIAEGDEKIADAIVDYAQRLESTLLVDESIIDKVETTKQELVESNSSIIFI